MTQRSRPALIQKSTRDFFREGRKTHGYTLFDFLHGYVYGRWPYLYIGVAIGTHPLARKLGPLADKIIRVLGGLKSENGSSVNKGRKQLSMADTYHGKVVPLESARQLISVKEEIHLLDLEKIIPYPRARDLILQNPEKIVVLECPCRAGREHPCLPLDVCLIVGEPFASFVSEHHPERSRWISQAEAVKILEEENARGHVHHAFFKDAMLSRYFAICNCCSCCCGAMQAHQHGTPMLASSGYVAEVDEELCISCGSCEQACPFNAISLNGSSSINKEVCMGCGVCVSRCDQGAISLRRAVEKGEPLEILKLLNKTGVN